MMIIRLTFRLYNSKTKQPINWKTFTEYLDSMESRRIIVPPSVFCTEICDFDGIFPLDTTGILFCLVSLQIAE